MLWKKESMKENALFTDLYAFNGGESRLVANSRRLGNKPQKPVKNEDESLEKRMEGNKYFGQGRWIDALESYNDSLCLAKKGSENISLTYANRSACFFKMRRHDECLNDIELAKKAGYPDTLMHKIDQRKIDCLKAIENGDSLSESLRTKLSLEPDEKFPCMANVLKIERGDDGEYSVVAAEDIDIGETVVVEKVFHVYLYELQAQKCNICLKSYTNLVPCNRCSAAMFCSDECRTNVLHSYECGLKYSENSQLNGTIMNDARGVLMAISMFSNVDEMMDFVKQTIQSDSKELPDSLSDDKSKYRAFLKLPINDGIIDSEQFVCLIFEINKLLQKIPKIDSMFNTKKYRRFLMHLIGQHIQIVENNSVQGCVRSMSGSNKGQMVTWYNHIGLIEKYFKHSCAPNVVTGEGDGNHVFITVRPIKKGEQLSFSYFMFLLDSKEKRQQILWERKRMNCRCSRCQGVSASSAQRQQLASDKNYQDIALNSSPMDLNDMTKVKAMTERCVTFLKKYNQITWCDEIGTIVQAYIYLLLRQRPLTLPTNA